MANLDQMINARLDAEDSIREWIEEAGDDSELKAVLNSALNDSLDKTCDLMNLRASRMHDAIYGVRQADSDDDPPYLGESVIGRLAKK